MLIAAQLEDMDVVDRAEFRSSCYFGFINLGAKLGACILKDDLCTLRKDAYVVRFDSGDFEDEMLS